MFSPGYCEGPAGGLYHKAFLRSLQSLGHEGQTAWFFLRQSLPSLEYKAKTLGVGIHFFKVL